MLEGFKVETPELPESYGIAASRTGRLPVGFRLPFTAFVGLLFAMTTGLLAIAGSNVAGMLLARATVRRREMATRLAVGASRGQLIGQMLIETLVLFVAAGLVAIPITLWLAGALQALLPTLPGSVQLDLSITRRALIFATGASLAAGALFGLAPARQALRAEPSRALHGHPSTANRNRLRLRHSLVVAQVALSLAMVITAGLFVRTLQAAGRIDSGFRTADVAVLSLDTATANTTGQETVLMIDRVADRLRSVGGVEAVGYARMIPLQGSSFGLGGVRVPGLDDASVARLDELSWDLASPGYFRTVGVPIVEGRSFTSDDHGGAALVAVVNETFARIAWPGQSAIGQRVWQPTAGDEQGRAIEIVGVSKDARYRVINESPRPFIHVPFAQHPNSRVELYVKHAEGLSLAGELRLAINSVEPDLPVVRMQSFDEATALGLLPQRLAAWIAGSVGVIGVFLAVLGLHGLTAFLVAQRTREIAIRMALGASRGNVRSMVLRQAALLGAGGAIVGMVIASGLGVAVQRLSLLVDVTPTDSVTFVGVAAALAVVLLAATYVPTRRAVATNPASALRAE